MAAALCKVQGLAERWHPYTAMPTSAKDAEAVAVQVVYPARAVHPSPSSGIHPTEAMSMLISSRRVCNPKSLMQQIAFEAARQSPGNRGGELP